MPFIFLSSSVCTLQAFVENSVELSSNQSKVDASSSMFTILLCGFSLGASPRIRRLVAGRMEACAFSREVVCLVLSGIPLPGLCRFPPFLFQVSLSQEVLLGGEAI